jgi:hypothetical protein
MSDLITKNSIQVPDTVPVESSVDTAIFVNGTSIDLQSAKTDSVSINSDTLSLLEGVIQNSSFDSDSIQLVNETKLAENNLPVNLRSHQNNDWMTIVIIILFILLVSVRAGFQKYIGSLFQSVVNYSTSFRMFREKNYSFLHGAFRLEVMYYIVFSVFVYQILTLQQSETGLQGFILFGKTMAIIVIYFLVKKFVYWFLGIVFNSSSETSEFLFNLDNNNRATSIVLFPVVALITYYPFGNPGIIVILGILAAGFFYLMSLWRGSIILLRKQFSIFYLFLYLCTLEFLPLLLILKMVVE